MSLRSAFIVLASAGLYITYEVNADSNGQFDVHRFASAVGADNPQVQAIVGNTLARFGVETGFAPGIGMGDADVPQGNDMIGLRARQQAEMARAAEIKRQRAALKGGGSASFEGESPFEATGTPSTGIGIGHTAPPGARFVRPPTRN